MTLAGLVAHRTREQRAFPRADYRRGPGPGSTREQGRFFSEAVPNRTATVKGDADDLLVIDSY
jgi:hypothetical protein